MFLRIFLNCSLELLFLFGVFLRGDFVDCRKHDFHSLLNGFGLEAVRRISEGVVIICRNGILRRKGYSADARLAERSGITAADGVLDAAGFFYAAFLHGFHKNIFKPLVESGKLPAVADYALEIILVRDAVHV